MRAGLLTGSMLAVALMLLGCGQKQEMQLTGKVTLAGKPLPSVIIVVTGPEGQTAGGTTNANGEYLIPDPPQGQLKFQFIAPATAQKKKHGPALPAKYATPKSGITFDYAGGKKTYDIDLKP